MAEETKSKSGIKPNNTIRVPSTKDNIFRYWLEFLSPFHHLTGREADVATAFLKERYNLSKVVLDNDLLDRTLMGEESQRKLKQECGLTNQHFQVIKSKLKNKKFFINNRINPKLIPKIKEVDEKGNPLPYFQLLLLFELK